MSEYNLPQIPKPQEAKVFERANRVLWHHELSDPNMQLFGRNGQKQFGVDATGLRDDDPNKIVGIQCKLKGHGEEFSADELEVEVAKAVTFKPLLSEYLVCTTAPDDTKVQKRALELSQEHSSGRKIPLKIRVLGWQSMEQLIAKHIEAQNAFDPSHTGQGERIETQLVELQQTQNRTLAEVISLRENGGMTNSLDEAVKTELDRQITEYATLSSTKPNEAEALLTALQKAHPDATGRIKFRIAANIANCAFVRGQTDMAAQGFIDAFELDPSNSKAVANKALGLLIQENWEELREFSQTNLRADPQNAALAGYFLQGMHAHSDISQPLKLIPSEVAEAPEVLMGLTRYYSLVNQRDNWYQAASYAYSKYPDVDGIAELHADALLEKVVSSNVRQVGQRLSAAQRADVTLAEALLSERWLTLKGLDASARPQALSVPANLMLAKRLLNDSEGAAAVGREAISVWPNEQILEEKLAAALLEIEAIDDAIDLLERQPSTTENVMMKYHVFLAKHKWSDLSILIEQQLDLFPEYEQSLAKAAKAVADAHLREEDRAAVLTSAAAELNDDPRALVLLSQAARALGATDAAKEYFDQAKSVVADRSNSFATRYALAHEARAFGDWRVIVDMLFDQLPNDTDTPELRLLATALVQDYPVRERALHFFASLPDGISNQAFYLKARGIMHLNRGDFSAAIPALTSAYEQNETLSELIPLLVAYHRSGQSGLLKDALDDLGIDSVPGSPVDRIQLAHILNDAGLAERAIAVGYAALCEAPNHAEVSQKFIGLVLERPDDNKTHNELFVEQGHWVVFESTDGDKLEGIVGSSVDYPWGVALAVDHPVIAGFLGKSVGAQITLEKGFDVSATWKITEVLPGWFRAGRDLLDRFNVRFPGVGGIVKMTTGDEENQLKHVFQQIKKKGEADQTRLDTYLKTPVPLSFIAGSHEAGAIGFADFVASRDADVRVADGNLENLQRSIAEISAHQQEGAVIDAFTAWRIAQLDLFPLFQKALGQLTLPSTELGQLQSLLALQDRNRTGVSMSTSFIDGEFYKQEWTQEEREEAADMIQSRISKITDACRIEPYTVPDELPDFMEELVAMESPDLLAPAILAEETRLFLTDDFGLRLLASNVLNTRSIWMQSVLLYALDSGHLSIDEYVEKLKHLAALRHGVLILDLPVLIKAFRSDGTTNLREFSALCRYLGHANADRNSHIRLACLFLNQVWATSVSRDGRLEIATGVVLAAMLNDDRNGQWTEWAARFLLALQPGPREHLISWCQAKSKPLAEAIDLIRRSR